MNDHKTKRVWIVWTNTDLTEGRGSEYPLAICETEAVALRLSRQADVMGSDARVEPFDAIDNSGQWLAPFAMEFATDEDKRRQSELDLKKDALTKAKKLGLSESEIAALRL